MKTKPWLGISCLVLCLWGLLACQSSPKMTTVSAQVQRVVSGQTIEVTIPSEQISLRQQVRLIGIVAPDLGQQPWGEEAKNILNKWLGNRPIIQLEFDQEERDSYQRRLAYIWHHQELINEKLVSGGYVLANPRSPNLKYKQRLLYAQNYARVMGLGIWHPQKPLRLTPDQFREQREKIKPK